MKKYKLVNNLHIGSVLLQTIIWIALIIVTFGLALPFFIYFFFKLIINTTEIHEFDLNEIEGHSRSVAGSFNSLDELNDESRKKKNDQAWRS